MSPCYKVVDVVAIITIDENYTKCIRKDSTHTVPSSSEPEIPNGYICGYEFFTDETINQSLALAQTRNEEKTKYPSPYVGLIYSEDKKYLVWPIKNGNELYISGIRHGPYYLVLSKERKLVDVVVKGYSDNFLRCIRSRKPPKAPASDPYSKLFVPPPRTGFLCGKAFFDDKILEDTAKIAKKKASGKVKGKFPKEHFGPPCNQKCLIWPILKDGSLYKKGNRGSYRFILTPNYKVMIVAISVGDEFKACERKTIKAKKNHDKSGYYCNRQSFSHHQLVKAAEAACKKMNSASNIRYPARYEGTGFRSDANGPYFTYPVLRNGDYRQSHASPHRVVINTNCEVVGALTWLNELPKSYKVVDVVAKITIDDIYTKCIRRDSSHTVPSPSEPEISNGYLCGYEFFTDETVHESLTLARTKFVEKTKYPSPYVGLIYPEDGGYMMWPIISGNKLYTSGLVFRPYYLILSKDRKLVDVVVRGYSNNFLRCIRSRKPPKAPASDPYSQLFVQPPKTGFFCGKTFFDNQVLQRVAEKAKIHYGNVIKRKFPIKFFGPPCDQPCLIWPLLKDGSLYKRGNQGPYRLVLTPEYKVMSVAVLVIDKLEACDIKTITAKKNHDESGYQ
ncbi:hypothetical protein EPUL_004393, partial [Erysiphe pulchra]